MKTKTIIPILFILFSFFYKAQANTLAKGDSVDFVITGITNSTHDSIVVLTCETDKQIKKFFINNGRFSISWRLPVGAYIEVNDSVGKVLRFIVEETPTDINLVTGEIKGSDRQQEFVRSQLEESWLAKLISWVLSHLNYWVVLLFMAIESSFIPFPSEVIVPPAAWLAMGESSTMNIFLVVVFATIGADIGALVNYWLARWLGRPVVYKFANSKFGHLCLINEEKVKHAEEYFRQHGKSSTFFGRLVPAVRQLISIPAGLAKMKMGPFLLYTTLGAGFWNTILAVIGYAIFKSFPDYQDPEQVSELAKTYSHEIGYAILGIAAIVIGYFIVKKMLKKRNGAEKTK